MACFVKREKHFFSRKRFLEKGSIGYVSRTNAESDELINLQMSKLKNYGCKSICIEILDNRVGIFDRPELSRVLKQIEPGVELLITHLDRICLNKSELIDLMFLLKKKGIQMRTMNSLIDEKPYKSFEQMLLGLLPEMIQLEETLVQDRVLINQSQIVQTVKNLGGRPKTSQAKENLVIRLRGENYSYREISKETGLALSTIRRIILENSKN